MPLERGTKVGVYEVVELLGRGGMGEVYRAHDTRLHRDVALKVLPDSFAGDRDRLARFEREAQILASLNHPHIAAIYGVDESGPVKALVLELVEGRTLADVIANGPLSVDDAVAVAVQIADALEAAHDRGIIHRDLKPANINVRDDGTVKVLDFGLARGPEPIARFHGSQSPTVTAAAGTAVGILLGTAAYMSPEQARGQAADRRCDVWAFGCVLYEMLSGKPAFAGGSSADLLGAVMHLDPDWQALPANLDPVLLWVLKGCLEKDPTVRLRDLADVRSLIHHGPAVVRSKQQPAGTRFAYAGWILALCASSVLIALFFLSPRRAASPEHLETRLQIVTPPADDPFSIALSPDGRSIVYEAQSDAAAMLWLRRLDADEAHPLAGTERATNPFWSPDSRSVAFFTGGALKRIDIPGGFVRTVTNAPNPRRGAWGPDGTILFGASVGPLLKVPADGGQPAAATTLLPGQINHRLPVFLPDGRRFLVLALGTPESRGLYVASLDGAPLRRVCDRETAFAFVEPNHLFVVKDGALWARRLDLDALSIEDGLVPVAPHVLAHTTTVGVSSLTTARTGSIAFRASAASGQLVWLDRTGRRIATVGQPGADQMTLEHLSLDGRTAAVARTLDGNTDVWLVDAERGAARRFTVDTGHDGTPVFSPDGRRLAYVSDSKADVWDIFIRPTDTTTAETLLMESGENKQALDWSSDGRFILYANQNRETDYDLWALPLATGGKPMPVAVTAFVEYDGRFSPDGEAVAFQSTDSGRPEIYLQPFPGTGPRVQVSVAGGRFPRWRRDGRELFYIGADDTLMSVDVTPATLSIRAPRALFRLPQPFHSRYEPSPNGQRFLVSSILSDASPITLISQWRPQDK